MSKLTKKEKKFCKTYLKTRDVGYTRLTLGFNVDISKKHIRKFIQSRPITKDFNIEMDPLLRKLYAIAMFDHISMYDKDGDVKPIKSLSYEQYIAIRTYRETSQGVTYTVHNQQFALDQILKLKTLQIKEAKHTEDNVVEDNGVNINIVLDKHE